MTIFDDKNRAVLVKVNGRQKQATVPSHTTLAEFLRDHLGQKGTKVACNQAACGACTVLMEGSDKKVRPIFACSTLLVQVQGANITTIEGLALSDALNPLQQAFIQHDALQCGFCTPGIIMALTAALATEGKMQSRDAIAQAISGNICRCGAYQHILNAAEHVIEHA